MTPRPSSTISRSPGRTRGLAAAADRHDLYQRAVQSVESEIDFVDSTFRKLRKRKAERLREDFCGTANTSCEWVRRRPTNIAVGQDLDGPTLDWGREHNLSKLSAAQRSRVHLHRRNVLDAPVRSSPRRDDDTGGVDIILAMNFSYWCFKDRATLVRYFRRVHESLAPGGVFFLDSYGGPDAIRILKERRPIGRKGARGSFTYIWDQAEVNLISSETICRIHFRMSDGSWVRNAFTYDWRVWTIPEIRELLAEAGFVRSTVYWEGDDGKGGGNGEFTASEVGDPCGSFICYISAEK